MGLRFAMVTDTHVGLTAASARRMSLVYAAIARLAPDFVLHCGDITDTGLPGEYERYWQSVPAALRGRIRHVPGNPDVRWDPAAKPGVANLLSILAAATGGDPVALADKYTQYGPLKQDTADAVVELLRPIQERYREFTRDPATTAELLELGAEKAQVIAAATLARARRAVGLLDRGEH